MVVQTNTPVVAPEDTALGLSEHDKAMIAKVDALNGTPATDGPVKPEGLPDKFWDAEKGVVKVDELAKSYTELERGKGAPKAAEDTPQGDAGAAAEAAEAAKAAGADTAAVDFTALSAEFATNGALSPESYAKLEASGLSKDLVDQYIDGQVALANTQAAEAYALAGGERQYATMLDWAAKNLPAAEQAAFDRAVLSDASSRKQAITAVRAQFEAAVGRNPQLITGNQGATNAGAYQSRAEVTADMRDPRYQKDPAFRARVESRLAVSSVF